MIEIEKFSSYINQLSLKDWERLFTLKEEIKATKTFGTLCGNEKVDSGVFTFPYWQRSEIVEKTVSVISSLQLTPVFDWGAWEEGKDILFNSDFDYNTLDTITLCKLLTTLIRADRFNEGYLMSCFEKGIVLKIITALENNVKHNPSIKITLTKGDITKISSDAIVNAANSTLMGGGGVDGAIHRAGGPVILEECKAIIARQGSCKTGEAVITSAGNLPSKFVIHTVGPIWKEGNSGESEKLKKCYLNSLKLAEEYGLSSIAFPNISTGVYGYPKQDAALIAVDILKNYSSHWIKEIIIVCFDEENYELYHRLLNKI